MHTKGSVDESRDIMQDVCWEVYIHAVPHHVPLVMTRAFIEYTRDDLVRLSGLHGMFGTYMDRWVVCKDRK
jgi:hypothetical protein